MADCSVCAAAGISYDHHRPVLLHSVERCARDASGAIERDERNLWHFCTAAEQQATVTSSRLSLDIAICVATLSADCYHGYICYVHEWTYTHATLLNALCVHMCMCGNNARNTIAKQRRCLRQRDQQSAENTAVVSRLSVCLPACVS